MVCRNCNRSLPDGTSYCHYCGAHQIEDLPPTVPVGMPKPEPISVNPHLDVPPMAYGETVPVEDLPPVMPEPVPVFDAQTPATAPVKYPEPGNIPAAPVSPPPAGGAAGILEKLGKFALPLAAVLLVVAIVLGVSNKNLKKQLEEAESASTGISGEYEEILAQLEETIGQQEQTIADQQTRMEALQSDADAYTAMVKAMTEHEIAFGSHTFQASDRFVVAKKGYTGTKITLTAHWNNEEHPTIYVKHSSDCASVSFDKDSWNKNVTLTVLPKEVGFTVATFSNSVDDTTFSVLILVVE